MMTKAKVLIYATLLSGLISSGAAYSQEEANAINAVRLQLPQIEELTHKEELKTFLESNISRLSPSTVDALDHLIASPSPLAVQILSAHSLDQKLTKFENKLNSLEKERFVQITARVPFDQAGSELDEAAKLQVNASLASKLEAFQTGLSSPEANEMVTRLTQFGMVSMSNFGVGK